MPTAQKAQLAAQLMTKENSPGQIFGNEKTGYYRLDTATKQPVKLTDPAQQMGVGEDIYKAETGLREELHQRGKGFSDRQTGFLTMEQLAQQGEGASDIALVLSLMKVYDPTSTVTGTEAANAQNAGGVPAAIRSRYNQLIGGGKLDQQSRDELVSAARIRFDQEIDNHGKLIDDYTKLAKSYKLDPTRVIQDVREPRLMQEREVRKVQQTPPEMISQMSMDQLALLDKHASKLSMPQLMAAAARKRQITGAQ